MTIAIHSRTFETAKLPLFRTVFDEILKRELDLIISKDLYGFLKNTPSFTLDQSIRIFDGEDVLLDTVDFMFSIGGDGTLLETVTFIKSRCIPVLGINSGRLGFLATIPQNKVKESLDGFFTGAYTIDSRTAIQCELDSGSFDGPSFGLNEFAVLKRDTSSMIVVHTYLDNDYLNSYWADGLLISTPTGSTGYSLSVGGPVVMPHSNSFIIAPVCPHNLNVRPLVVSDSSVITLKVEGRTKNFLVSLDSRSRKVDAGVQITVQKCAFPAMLVKLHGDNFLNTLRLKLNWGLDARN